MRVIPAPECPPKPVSLSEATGPVFGHDALGALDNDMIRNAAVDGDAVGERIVHFKDIAEVRRTYKDAESYARLNGKPAIAMVLISSKAQGTTIQDRRRSGARLPQIRQQQAFVRLIPGRRRFTRHGTTARRDDHRQRPRGRR